MDSKIEKRFMYKGHPCVVMFQPMGFRTGYVGVLNDSIFYGKGSSILNTIFECHGGITYTESRLYGQNDEATWWIGFDCGHAWDGYDTDSTWKYFHKNISDMKRLYNGEVRTKEYVEDQCRLLVDQIEALDDLTELDIVIRIMEQSYEDMSEVTVKYLKAYRDMLNKPLGERLIDVLREVRGEK